MFQVLQFIKYLLVYKDIVSLNSLEFQSKLITESWEDIFEESDTNVIFNNFLDI
jgi:hypothetical protein